jgi:hypothetical protein
MKERKYNGEEVARWLKKGIEEVVGSVEGLALVDLDDRYFMIEASTPLAKHMVSDLLPTYAYTVYRPEMRKPIRRLDRTMELGGDDAARIRTAFELGTSGMIDGDENLLARYVFVTSDYPCGTDEKYSDIEHYEGRRNEVMRRCDVQRDEVMRKCAEMGISTEDMEIFQGGSDVTMLPSNLTALIAFLFLRSKGYTVQQHDFFLSKNRIDSIIPTGTDFDYVGYALNSELPDVLRSKGLVKGGFVVGELQGLRQYETVGSGTGETISVTELTLIGVAPSPDSSIIIGVENMRRRMVAKRETDRCLLVGPLEGIEGYDDIDILSIEENGLRYVRAPNPPIPLPEARSIMIHEIEERMRFDLMHNLYVKELLDLIHFKESYTMYDVIKAVSSLDAATLADSLISQGTHLKDMSKGKWLFEAMEKKELKITNDNFCPKCIESGRDKPKPNAHKIHMWANRIWLENYMNKMKQ